MTSRKKPQTVYIVSDATGATAKSVLASVLVQFEGMEFDIKHFPFVRTKKQVDNMIEQAPEGDCIIVFTLVSASLREKLIDEGKKKNLMVVDVMGPLIKVFSKSLRHSPKMRPGAFRQQDQDMFRLSEAIHYTRSHDDGLGLDTIHEADLIILGVSRTGKTPTSIYLSCRNLKVANIPVILNVPFPMEIARLPIKKVGFTIDMERLVHLRSERVRRMSIATVPGYSSLSYIVKELEYCDKIYSKVPMIYTIDVTKRSIEEISEWITHGVL